MRNLLRRPRCLRRPGKPQAIPLKKSNYATDCRINRQRNAILYAVPCCRRRLLLQPRGKSAVRLALYEPDIPQNTGTLLRLAACFGIALDLIEPAGFLLDDRRLKRASLDYADLAAVTRHSSWAQFITARDPESRLILMTTAGTVPLHRFDFAATDTI